MLRARGCRAVRAAPQPRVVTPSQLDAMQDGSLCSWVQRGCCGAGVQVGWEGASKKLCVLLQPPWHGGTWGMSLPTTTLKSCAVPGIWETGVIHEEAQACIHLSWGDIKE